MKAFNYSVASDRELLVRFEQGREESAFAELVARHGTMVMQVAMRNLDCREDAEDAFQATFLALAKAVGRLRQKQFVAAWLHSTVRKTASAMRRGIDRRKQTVEQILMLSCTVNSEAGDPATHVDHDEQLRILDEEIQRLPRKFQVAIVLCHLEGLSQRQAADRLEISQSSLRDVLAKGRTLLKSQLLRRGVTASLSGLTVYAATSSEASAAVSSTLIAATTRKSLLYAAGKSATEVGANPTVIRAANKVIATMTTAKLAAIGLTALTILTITGALAEFLGNESGKAQAGSLYVEEFTDASPGNWIPWHDGRGTVSVVDGELVLTPNSRLDMLVYAKGVETKNVSVRTAVRVTDEGAATIAVRADTEQEQVGAINYGIGIGYSSEVGGSVGFAALSNGNEGVGEMQFVSQQGRPLIGIPYDVRTENTFVQIDVIGNTYRGWFWRVGEDMPAEPQFEITDDTNSNSGVIVLGALNRVSPSGSDNSSSVFSSIQIADMPIHELTVDATCSSLNHVVG